MKYIKQGITIALIAIIAFGCGNDNTDNQTVETKTSETSKSDEKRQDTPKSDWRKNVKDLEALKPLTKNAMENWLPTNIAGLERGKHTINAYEDLSTLNTKFQSGETFLTLNIVDGAGTRGSQLVAPAHIIATQNLDQKTHTGYVKTVKKNGIIANERYEDAIKKYNLKFLYKNRLYVTIRSNLKRDQIWQAIEDMDFENLFN